MPDGKRRAASLTIHRCASFHYSCTCSVMATFQVLRRSRRLTVATNFLRVQEFNSHRRNAENIFFMRLSQKTACVPQGKCAVLCYGARESNPLGSYSPRLHQAESGRSSFINLFSRVFTCSFVFKALGFP